MLHKQKAAARFQNALDFLHDLRRIGNRAQDLRADHGVHTVIWYGKLFSGPCPDINAQTQLKTQLSQIAMHERVGFDANPPNADGEINQIHAGPGTNFQHVSVDPCKQSLLPPCNTQLIPSIETSLNQCLSPLPATEPRPTAR